MWSPATGTWCRPRRSRVHSDRGRRQPDRRHGDHEPVGPVGHDAHRQHARVDRRHHRHRQGQRQGHRWAALRAAAPRASTWMGSRASLARSAARFRSPRCRRTRPDPDVGAARLPGRAGCWRADDDARTLAARFNPPMPAMGGCRRSSSPRSRWVASQYSRTPRAG